MSILKYIFELHEEKVEIVEKKKETATSRPRNGYLEGE